MSRRRFYEKQEIVSQDFNALRNSNEKVLFETFLGNSLPTLPSFIGDGFLCNLSTGNNITVTAGIGFQRVAQSDGSSDVRLIRLETNTDIAIPLPPSANTVKVDLIECRSIFMTETTEVRKFKIQGVVENQNTVISDKWSYEIRVRENVTVDLNNEYQASPGWVGLAVITSNSSTIISVLDIRNYYNLFENNFFNIYGRNNLSFTRPFDNIRLIQLPFNFTTLSDKLAQISVRHVSVGSFSQGATTRRHTVPLDVSPPEQAVTTLTPQMFLTSANLPVVVNARATSVGGEPVYAFSQGTDRKWTNYVPANTSNEAVTLSISQRSSSRNELRQLNLESLYRGTGGSTSLRYGAVTTGITSVLSTQPDTASSTDNIFAVRSDGKVVYLDGTDGDQRTIPIFEYNPVTRRRRIANRLPIESSQITIVDSDRFLIGSFVYNSSYERIDSPYAERVFSRVAAFDSARNKVVVIGSDGILSYIDNLEAGFNNSYPNVQIRDWGHTGASNEYPFIIKNDTIYAPRGNSIRTWNKLTGQRTPSLDINRVPFFNSIEQISVHPTENILYISRQNPFIEYIILNIEQTASVNSARQVMASTNEDLFVLAYNNRVPASLTNAIVYQVDSDRIPTSIAGRGEIVSPSRNRGISPIFNSSNVNDTFNTFSISTVNPYSTDTENPEVRYLASNLPHNVAGFFSITEYFFNPNLNTISFTLRDTSTANNFPNNGAVFNRVQIVKGTNIRLNKEYNDLTVVVNGVEATYTYNLTPTERAFFLQSTDTAFNDFSLRFTVIEGNVRDIWRNDLLAPTTDFTVIEEGSKTHLQLSSDLDYDTGDELIISHIIPPENAILDVGNNEGVDFIERLADLNTAINTLRLQVSENESDIDDLEAGGGGGGGGGTGSGVDSDDMFPTSPDAGDLFVLYEDITDFNKGLYRYSGTIWELIAGIAGGIDPSAADNFLQDELGETLTFENGDPITL